MEESKSDMENMEEINDVSEPLSNSINNDNIDNIRQDPIYGETVLCSQESLQRLPETILNLLYDYERHLLPPTTKEEVQELLGAWFRNEPICEQSTLSSEPISGQSTSQFLKRRRFDSNV